MSDFPAFMKNPANRVKRSQQATPGVEGYVFDGVDGSQMAFWTCSETTASAEHVHDYEEYVVCVDGDHRRPAHRAESGPGVLHRQRCSAQ